MNWRRVGQCVLRYKAVLLTALALALAVNGAIQRGVALIGEPLARMNDQYLDQSLKSTVHVMIPVGVAKAAADVVEGSTAVVEWGDITQPILDYLDVAWRILILSLIVTTATKYILLGVAPLAGMFLVLALALYFVFAIIRCFTAPTAILRLCLRRMAGLFLLTYLLLAVILPLTIFGTGELSRTITEPLRASTFESFDRIGEVFSLEAITRQEGFLGKADSIQKKAVEIIRFCGTATADIAGSVAKLAVVKVLEGVVFPVACLAFLIWLVRGTLYPALGLSDRSLARDDYQRIGRFLEGAVKAQTEAKPPDAEQ